MAVPPYPTCPTKPGFTLPISSLASPALSVALRPLFISRLGQKQFTKVNLISKVYPSNLPLKEI